MGDIAVRVEDLSKKYRLGTIGYGSLRYDLAAWWARVRGMEDPNTRIGEEKTKNLYGDFWALKGVSFELNQGDRLGVIGRNGAGKSTLLKILSQITRPTSGTIKLRGRVASLLEVGTGFHPELTGRENVMLNGAIMGMKRREIQKKFDEILDFSGVEQFIDTPVKRYSSGMYVRLAFAVAAHLEPDILIVDEVLAVGDAEFQKKCLGKMEDVSKNQGRTVIFVSHNMSAIKTLCARAIWLQNGVCTDSGPAASIVQMYLAHSLGASTEGQRVFDLNPWQALQLHSVAILDERDMAKDLFECDERIKIRLSIIVRRRESGSYGYLALLNAEGVCILESDSNEVYRNAFESLSIGENIVDIMLQPRTLGVGDYIVYLSFTDRQGNTIDNPGMVSRFRLADSSTVRGNSRNGYISTLLPWTIKQVTSGQE